MTYAQNFSLATPTGLEEANTLDEIIRNVKIALNERFVDILGVDLSSATDPQRVTKIVIPSAGMTIRDSNDVNSLISFTNSGAAIRNASFTGTAPTLPSGSILISPSISGATLTGTTTAGVINSIGNNTFTGDLTVTGTVVAGGISGPTVVPASNVTAGTFAAGNFTFPSNLNVSGTLAPTTLTIPSGTTIPTHTETGTITAGGSTRNGGTISGATLSGTTTNSGTLSGGTISGATISSTTISSCTISGTTTNSGTISGGTVSGATLNNTTFTGTVSGISSNPTTATYELGSDTAFTGTVQTILSVNPGAGTWVAIVSVNMAMTIPASTTGTIYASSFCSGMSGNARMGRVLNNALAAQETMTGTLSLIGTTSSGTFNVSVFGNSGGTVLAAGTRILMIKIA